MTSELNCSINPGPLNPSPLRLDLSRIQPGNRLQSRNDRATGEGSATVDSIIDKQKGPPTGRVRPAPLKAIMMRCWKVSVELGETAVDSLCGKLATYVTSTTPR